MATVTLVVASSPTALLERAAEGFLTPRPASPADPFPTVPYWLAVRQGGVRDDVIALARARRIPGWFDPPLRIFHELPGILGNTLPPISGVARDLLVRRVMAESIGAILGGRWRSERYADALNTLFGDLVAGGVTPAAWGAALALRTDRDEFERRRDGDLTYLYHRYTALLAETGQRDGRDIWLDCARAVAADPAAFAHRLRGRRELRLFGLQDLRRGWRALLDALAASPALDRIVIYSSESLDLGPHAEVVRLAAAHPVASRLFAPGDAAAGAPVGPAVRFIAAPDAERELEEVARRIRELADGGTPLARIAIVAREARPYLDLALTALDRFGVPATARRRHPLRDIPVIRAVRALLAAAGDGWERHGLAELAEQPFFASDLDARIINYIGFQRRVAGILDWAAALDDLLHECERRAEPLDDGDRERHARTLPPTEQVRSAVEHFTRFALLAQAIDGSRAPAAWLAWLEQFLADDPWRIRRQVDQPVQRRFDLVRLDQAGLRMLARVVAEWKDAESGGANDGGTISAKEFAARLDRQLHGDVAQWTTSLRGVQVLEGFAAAYRTFDHLFIVGLEGNRFPVPAPASPLLDDADRNSLAAAGLPIEPRETWEHREEELFRVLVAGAANTLTLSWSQLDASGSEILRSGFVEAVAEAAGMDPDLVGEPILTSRVLTPGARIHRGAASMAQALHAVRIERTRATGTLSPWNGEIADPALIEWLATTFGESRTWSASQLESYARCPWAFFSGRLLKLEKLEDPDDAMDPAVRGTLFHDALRRFYDAASARVGGPVFLRDADLAWAQPMLAAALAAALTASGAMHSGPEALAAAARGELQRLLARYLAFEAEQNEDSFNNRTRASKQVRTGVVAHEVAFEDTRLDRHGVTFRYRGFIDRVEVGVDERIQEPDRFLAAVDYKSSRHGVPGERMAEAYADKVVLQLALYAHALRQLHPDKTIARVEYRALKQREVVYPLALVQVTPKSGATAADDEGAATMSSALDAAAEHVAGIRGGHFPADPPDSCGCPPFCHAIDICRVKGGPRLERF